MYVLLLLVDMDSELCITTGMALNTAYAQAMAVAGAREGSKPAGKSIPADPSSVESLIRELGGTQHLDRERAISRLRASLRDTGMVRKVCGTAFSAAARCHRAMACCALQVVSRPPCVRCKGTSPGRFCRQTGTRGLPGLVLQR